MKTVKTDISYLNKLVRELLTDSAVGFVALAAIVMLMSVLLHYDSVLRPNHFVTAKQSSRQLDQVGALIASTDFFVQSPATNPGGNDPANDIVATQPATVENVLPPTPAAAPVVDQRTDKEIAKSLSKAENTHPTDKKTEKDKPKSVKEKD
jgi:hypothetical protein